ncbi:MAG TPA: galactokinase [Abditibacteriaceae bacterium]|nr:galactokinase [Abditibacteriaceae bacterium]
MNMQDLRDTFVQHFGDDSAAFTVRAPGRVNLIGEHVDYNDGLVLPMALSLQTMLRVRPRADQTVRLYATEFNEEQSFSLDSVQKTGSWIDYVQGVADELQKRGLTLQGFEGIIESTIPIASGLSSSAAIEVGACLAFLHIIEYSMAPSEVALLCQAAENKFIGVNSGIMDQMAVAACEQDHALLLDCRDLTMRQVPFKLSEYSVVVTDSGAPRELASSAYNERRAQCEEGLAILQKSLPHAKSLRDVSPTDLASHVSAMPVVVRDRVRHVVQEIARTQEAVSVLEAGDLARFGELMNQSHGSLRVLYQVSSRELDWLTDWARNQDGVAGSRMTGAGFGGCTVSLVRKDKVADFMANQPIEYSKATGRTARCWECEAAQGAQVLDF